MARPEEGQAESLAGERALAHRERPFGVQADQAQGDQQRGGGRDLPELAHVGEHQQAGHGHAPGQHVDKQPIAEHPRRGGIEQATDQRRNPEVPLEPNQVIGMVEIEVQRHDQACQQRQCASGGLVARAQGDDPAAAQQRGVAQPQGHGDHRGVLEDSQGRQPDDQAQNQQGAAETEQPLDAAGIEQDLPERPPRRARRRGFGGDARRGLACRGPNGRRGRSRLHAQPIRRGLPGRLGSAGRALVDDARHDGLTLLLQSRAENRDSPFCVIHAGVGLRERQPPAFTVRLDHHTGVGPVAQLPHLRTGDRHSARGTVRGRTAKFRTAPPATVAGRKSDACGNRLVFAGHQLQPCAKLVVGLHDRRKLGSADQAVPIPVQNAVLHELSGRQQVLPCGRGVAGGATLVDRGQALTANTTG